jgi:hypothetical protein
MIFRAIRPLTKKPGQGGQRAIARGGRVFGDVVVGELVFLLGRSGRWKVPHRRRADLMIRARHGDALVLLGRLCVEHGEEVMPLAPVGSDLMSFVTSRPRHRRTS